MGSKYKYEKELTKLLNDEDNIEYFVNISLKYQRSNTDLYKEVFDEMLKFAKENNLKKAKAWAYYYLGWYYFDILDYDKSIDTFLISNDIFENVQYIKGIIYACNGLNSVYHQIGQFKLAVEWGLKGISLCEEINEKKALIILLLNSGINYLRMNYFQKSKEIYKTIEMMGYDLNLNQKIAYYCSLAEIEINVGDAGKALDFLEEAIKLGNELGYCNDMGEIYKLKGMAYVKLEKFDKAKHEFMNSYLFSDNIDDRYEKCCSMLEWSKLCILVDENNEAKQVLNDVIEICKSYDLNILLRQSYHLLYLLNKKTGDFKESLKYLEEYILIDEQMYDYEQNQLMAKLNVKHSEREADLYKLLYDKTELLSSIGQKIISKLDFNSILEIINNEINKLVNADILGIAVYDNEKEEAVYNFVHKNSLKINFVTFKVNEDDSFGAYCIKNKEDIIIGNADKEYMYYKKSMGVNGLSQPEKSMIYTPLIINDKVIGVMTIQSYKVNAYNKNDLNTLKIIANYSAIAIDNAVSFKKIENQATHDNMTGFLTRFEIIKLGQIIYDKYKNNETKFSIIMIDIDNFKSINDNFGHDAGDTAINLITKSISNSIRSTDYIGRYGGDEFLLVCPGADQDEAVEVAERIRRTVSNKIYLLGNDNIMVKITISLGVYEFGQNDMSFIDGVKVADKCMYCAKKGTKNKVAF